MEPPQPDNLAHDLRNLLGLVRALATQLPGLVEQLGPSEPDELTIVARELDAYSRYALEALRVIEKWNAPRPTRVHLGALGWAVRLAMRDLVVGDLSAAGYVDVVVPGALSGGAALLRAIGPGRRVSVELVPGTGALAFETGSGAADPAALEAALGELRAAGLAAELVRAVPCRVEVSAPTRSGG